MLDGTSGGAGLIVAITTPVRVADNAHRHRPDANPFSFDERRELIAAGLAEHGVTPHAVVGFDLAAPETWARSVPLEATQLVGVKSAWERSKLRMLADAGYRTRALAAGRLSSSLVRDALRCDARDTWTRMVPPSSIAIIERLLRSRPLAER